MATVKFTPPTDRTSIVEWMKAFGFDHFESDDAFHPALEGSLGAEAAVRSLNRASDQFYDPGGVARYYTFVAECRAPGRALSQRSDDIAQGYEAVAQLIEPGESILDLGCFLGYGSLFLASVMRNSQVTGVDIAISALGTARRATKITATNNVAFARLDLESEVPSGTFDTILDLATLQYLGDPERVRALSACLRPGGKLISVPQLGRVGDIKAWISLFDDQGLTVTDLQWVCSKDCGMAVARPLLVACASGKPWSGSLGLEFEAIKGRLASGEVNSLWGQRHLGK